MLPFCHASVHPVPLPCHIDVESTDAIDLTLAPTLPLLTISSSSANGRIPKTSMEARVVIMLQLMLAHHSVLHFCACCLLQLL
jgi:hypothetical protein